MGGGHQPWYSGGFMTVVSVVIFRLWHVVCCMMRMCTHIMCSNADSHKLCM
jgi:hypothetical protein